MDYNQFVGGVIKNCVVYYYGGDFSLSETRMENVRFAMAGGRKWRIDVSADDSLAQSPGV